MSDLPSPSKSKGRTRGGRVTVTVTVAAFEVLGVGVALSCTVYVNVAVPRKSSAGVKVMVPSGLATAVPEGVGAEATVTVLGTSAAVGGLTASLARTLMMTD